MSDISITDTDVKVTMAACPECFSNEDIKINACNGTVEVKPTISRENIMKLLKYLLRQILKLPESSYNNGMLEITFKKKSQAKPKG